MQLLLGCVLPDVIVGYYLNFIENIICNINIYDLMI